MSASDLKLSRAAFVTDAELRMLELVLRELRHAYATRQQLTIIIDPWVLGRGANVSFHYNGLGYSAEVEGGFISRRKRARAPRGVR